jgi:hypothetical protein
VGGTGGAAGAGGLGGAGGAAGAGGLGGAGGAAGGGGLGAAGGQGGTGAAPWCTPQELPQFVTITECKLTTIEWFEPAVICTGSPPCYG